MTNTFTVWKINIDKTFSHKEHLNNWDEVNQWINEKNFANFAIQGDRTGRLKTFSWNGDKVVLVSEVREIA
jgi:L-rhamnose mutarotase|tara:strand:+ start:1867 stop:2079 length:213 start_codon:yes stop_codon:yes gene_type:complete